MIKFDTSGSCKILISHLVPTVARRNTYACQVEPNAENCQVPWTQSVDSPVQLSPPCGVRSNPDKSCPHPCAYCKRNRSTRSNLPAIQWFGNTPVGVHSISAPSLLSTYARPHPLCVYPPLYPLLRNCVAWTPLSHHFTSHADRHPTPLSNHLTSQADRHPPVWHYEQQGSEFCCCLILQLWSRYT